ncbi:unnamed protein product, partial [Mesorhabditis belari]|uniref:Spermatogenesis-defective protein 39 homolog n=1 Tax=Mesorhabditis belari TaxID=2138241 RepID=A0AAF3FLR3_9BILA
MNARNQFNFLDEEDQYWNENGSTNSSFFDDRRPNELLAKHELTRMAMDNLFEDVRTPCEASTSKQPPPPPQSAQTTPTWKNNVAFSAHQIRSAITTPLKMEAPRLPPKAPFPDIGLKPAASVVSIAPSECSVSSFPSDAQQQEIDYNRLKNEHRKLQRHFEMIRAERYKAPDVRETTRRLFMNEPVTLDLYKSKAEKLALLDAAIEMIDGNVILAVVFFIQRTVSESIFREILLQKPKAAEQYIQYLKDAKNVDELMTTMCALGRTTEAAMIEFNVAMEAKTVTQKVFLLKKALGSTFLDPNLQMEREQVRKYLDLVERQTQIKAADSQDKSKLFTDYPKNASLIGQPATHTLYYSCLYHHDDPTTSQQASPQAIKDLCHLNDKQLTWMSIQTLVKQNRWLDIEKALCPRSLLPNLGKTSGYLNHR